MNYFSLQEKEEALTRAFKENSLSKRNPEGFIFDVNDCFSLLVRYDKFLRGTSLLKEVIKGYTSNDHFFSLLSKHFNSSLTSLFLYSGMTAVSTPEVGDFAVVRDMQGSYSICIKRDNTYWVTSSQVEGHDKIKDSIITRRAVSYFRPIKGE